jgi:hypothetical protein
MAYEETKLYREPVNPEMVQFMADHGYAPVWAYQYETEEAQHTMGQREDGQRAIFYWTIDGVFSGPFRPISG